jgi:16S rRNA C1402 N4-methylase RsmH
VKEGKKLEKEDSRFTIHHHPFGCMDRVLAPLGVAPQGVFFDLGISVRQRKLNP